MKKIMLTFMLLASMTVAMAQKPSQKKSVQPKAQTTLVQIMDESSFDDYDLSSSQQKKVRTLNQKYKKKSKKQSQQQYNAELKKVLSSSQYKKYVGKKSSNSSKKQQGKSSRQLKTKKSLPKS